MHRIKYSLLISFCFVISIRAVKAQSPEEEVQAVVERFFVGLNTQDTSMIKETLAKSIRLENIIAKDSVLVKEEPVQRFLLTLAKAKDLFLEERILEYQVKVDKQMAIVWAPYEFYFNDQLSHCGTNLFTLIHTGRGWKIHNLIDTRRKKNCMPDGQ